MTETIDREEELLWFRGYVLESGGALHGPTWNRIRTSTRCSAGVTRRDSGERSSASSAGVSWSDSGALNERNSYVDDQKGTGTWATRRRRTRDQVSSIVTWLDVSRYREDARKLGYDDEALNLLVERWTLLLEKARRGSVATGSVEGET